VSKQNFTTVNEEGDPRMEAGGKREKRRENSRREFS
jgi:hypothetical protein